MILPSPLLWLALSLPPHADDPPPAEVIEAQARITLTSVRATEHFLASDFLAGRDTPSPELEIAAAYIESRFRASGLQPLEATGTYRHEIELPGSLAPAEGPVGSLQIGNLDLDLGRAGALVPYGATATPREVDAALYWVGAPAALLAVPRGAGNGKVGVVVEGTPAPESLDEQVRGPFGDMGPELTARLASRSGFAALIFLCADDDTGAATMADGRSSLSEPQLRPRRRSSSTPLILLRSPELHAALAATESASGEPGDMDGTMKAHVPPSTDRPVLVDNVAGVLPGRDPKLAEEVVLVTAHYDHIGIGARGGDDIINNGADDNATGTTAVIHLAETFAGLSQRPRRTLVFVAFAGEEKGLLGSRAWAADPPIPLERTVANVNIEMVGRPDDIGPDRAWITGFQYSDLGPILAAAAETAGVRMDRHETMGDRLFGASDNYSFAEKGVVAHTISAGSLHGDYHKPSDEADKIDFENMTRVIRATLLGVWAVAEREARPAWNDQAPEPIRAAAQRRP